MQTKPAASDNGCFISQVHKSQRCESELLDVQRARLLNEGGEEIAAGLARIDFGAPMNVVLVDLEPVAPLAQALAHRRREYWLELEAGITMAVQAVGSASMLTYRRVCFLRVLSAPLQCYCRGQASHGI